MEVKKIATLSDDLKRFVQSGNYEPHILKLMNRSKVIFPGHYERNLEQSENQCDFYDVKTGEKFEAKLPFDKKEGELICSNHGSLKAWLEFMMDEEAEFGEKIIMERGKHRLDSLKLYKTLRKRLESVQKDENAVILFPYPITLDMEGNGEVNLLHCCSDILSSGSDFIKLFVASSVSKRMENGEPAYLAGKSGIEIVVEVIAETMSKEIDEEPQVQIGRSREYWIGWAVAYYQWHSARRYGDIFKAVSFDNLQNMYYSLHEADISKFVGVMDLLMQEFFPETNLKRIRTAYGCTQADLAKLAGVNLRSIQMYEQRNKDINKASVETIHRIAKVLGCTIEDLMEK